MIAVTRAKIPITIPIISLIESPLLLVPVLVVVVVKGVEVLEGLSSGVFVPWAVFVEEVIASGGEEDAVTWLK